jgi:peptidoglycan/LPS O-acetylase OafA/YrhL
VSRYGWLGVELFFLISGFVICMSSWGRTVGEFAISRIVRLYPAYWVAVLLTAAMLTLFPLYQEPLSTVDTLANLTMVQELLNVADLDLSYWTLLVELNFYVLFAIVVARGLTYKRVVVFCLAWTLASLVAMGFGGQLALIMVSRYAPYFIAGVAFYLIKRFSGSMLLWGIVGFSWVIALVRLKSEIAGYPVSFRYAAVIVTFFFLLMGAVATGRLDWVKWPWVATMGLLTYPLYLLHQVIGLTVIKAMHGYIESWVLLVTVVLALMLVAWLMHLLVERPGSRLLKRGLQRSLEQLRRTPNVDRRGRVPEQVVAKTPDELEDLVTLEARRRP